MKRQNLLPALFMVASAASILPSFALAGDGNSGSSNGEICPTMFADFRRRQRTEFFSDGPFGIADSAKHVPVLTISGDGTTGTVVVGNGNEVGGEWHPMVASEDPGEVHFVTHIVVTDQDGNVVALEAMDPTVAAPASMTFAVPAGVAALTPYEWCDMMKQSAWLPRWRNRWCYRWSKQAFLWTFALSTRIMDLGPR